MITITSPIRLIFTWVILKQVSGKICAGYDLSQYAGKVAVTNGGRICQKWASQTPHAHLFNTDTNFPLDHSVEDASNYCRSVPSIENYGDRFYPWCLTTDPKKRMEYCNKPICGEPVCGGIISEPIGLLRSPDTNGDGNYDDDLDCLWTLEAPEGSVIELDVTQIDMETTRACFTDFLAIYDSTRHYGRYCGPPVWPPIIQSTSNTLYVRFYSDPQYSSHGFTAQYMHINATVTNGTTEAPDELPDYLVDNWQTSNDYGILREGYRSHPRFGNCNTKDNGVKRSLPIAAVGDVMCPADVDIGLYAGNVNITSTGRTCRYWKDLEYTYEGSTAEDENFCRNLRYMNTPFPWCETTEGKVDYCIDTVCKGTPCGGNVTAPSGWLSGIDSDGDGNYDVMRECLWTLIAPAKHHIVVTLLFLSIEDSTKCDDEMLLIYRYFVIAETFCGHITSLPLTLQFNSNLVYVLFHSWTAGGAPGPGFNLTYSHVAAESLTSPPTKPVTHSIPWVDSGLLTSSATTPDKEMSSDPVNFRFPTTLSGLDGTKLTRSGVIRMPRSNTPVELAMIGWILVLN